MRGSVSPPKTRKLINPELAKTNSGFIYIIRGLFHFSTKGTKRKYHKLEALKPERNSDDGQAANKACSEIIRGKLPTRNKRPNCICNRMLTVVSDYGLSKWCKCELGSLKTLLSERDSDNGY